MQKLYKLLGRDKAIEGDVGIEIEAEGKAMSIIDNKYWRTEDDGSLRGQYPDERAEFVLKKPIAFDEAEKAIDSLVAFQEDAEFKFSFRTSVHVHLNIQDMTHAQLCNLIYTYYLLEEPLLTFCGEGRKANRFCLRLRDAEAMVPIIENIFRDTYGILGIPPDGYRYAALNLEAFRKYGSVEFRAMRGTLDKEVLLTWVNIIKSLKMFAMAAKNPKEIHDGFRQVGGKKFLYGVLNADADKVYTQGIEGFINESYSLSYDMPFSYVEAVERIIEEGVWQEEGMPASAWEIAQFSRVQRSDYDYFIRLGERALIKDLIDAVRRNNNPKKVVLKKRNLVAELIEEAPLPDWDIIEPAPEPEPEEE